MDVACELVIFDNDGVLVDSEHLTHQVLVEMLDELGVQMALEEALSLFKGGKMSDCLAEVERRHGRPLAGDFEGCFRGRCDARYQRELRPVDGVEEMLTQLQVPFCVASNGPETKIRSTLGATGLLPHFENRVFSAYTRRIFKPEPDLFLHAAQMCGAEVTRCVVVEDSLHGVLAARAAGMRVLAYAPRGDTDGLEEHGAEVFEAMNQLLDLL